MKIYNVIGYSLLAIHVFVSGLLAPPGWGFAAGAVTGFAYMIFVWFVVGLCLSDVLHMGIAHSTLEYRKWFIKFVTVFSNTVGIYIDPVSWVNRHRHHHAFSDHDGDPNKLADDGFWRTLYHHAFSDHDGDPNKLADDGFWRTLYLCLFPYKCKSNLAQDTIFKSWPFRLVANPYFAAFSQISSYGLLWLAVRDWKFALVLWVGVRLFATWINMVQNYWTHDRRFGTRRYNDEHDHAMNLGEWLPVTASFSASLQNNHHHFPRFLRTSHHSNEYDFGFMTVRVMKAMGLVKASPSGRQKPEGIPLTEIGF